MSQREDEDLSCYGPEDRHLAESSLWPCESRWEDDGLDALDEALNREYYNSWTGDPAAEEVSRMLDAICPRCDGPAHEGACAFDANGDALDELLNRAFYQEIAMNGRATDAS